MARTKNMLDCEIQLIKTQALLGKTEARLRLAESFLIHIAAASERGPTKAHEVLERYFKHIQENPL